MTITNFRPYEQRGGNPKFNAQANLRGRTHYVDDDSLGFHKARVISARPVDDGLLYAIVESVAIDWDNTRRGYRYVVFDICGNVVSRVPLEECFTTSAKATKAMWEFLNDADAQAITAEALDRAEHNFAYDLAQARAKLNPQSEAA